MQKNNKKGFTIIELLVVIVIIGILIALALPNLFSAQARGRDSDRKNELKNLKTKLETHYNDNGSYPNALSGLDPAPSDDEIQGPKGASDAYGYTSDGESYTLTATLENKKDPEAGTNGLYTVESVNQSDSTPQP